MKLQTILVTATALTVLAMSPAMSQNAKVGAATDELGLTETGSFNEHLMLTVRVPSQESMVFHVSFECGIYTRTVAKSKGGNKDTQGSAGKVNVRVEVQDLSGGHVQWASPGGDGGVTFCSRSQVLSATLQGIIDNLACFVDDDNDPETPDVFDPDAAGCLLTEEEIELVLDTLNANAFNFTTSESLSSGDYIVSVQAELLCDTTGDGIADGNCPFGTTDDDWEARALLGRGSLIVDEVRFGAVP
jgi:hypothetical protein